MAVVTHTWLATDLDKLPGTPVLQTPDVEDIVHYAYNVSNEFGVSAQSEVVDPRMQAFVKFCEDNKGSLFAHLYRDGSRASLRISCDLPGGGSVAVLHNGDTDEYAVITEQGSADVIVAVRGRDFSCMVDDKKRLVCKTVSAKSGAVPGIVIDSTGSITPARVDAKKISEWELSRL